MIPGRKTNLHYVPYDGNIETHIDDARANALTIKHETPDVSRTLVAQMQRMTDAGIEYGLVLPTANGLIVSCDNPQQAYDAVYGGMSLRAANDKNNVVAFKPFTTVALNAEFSGAAANDQGISRAPVLHGAFDRATKGPALGGFDFETRVLAA